MRRSLRPECLAGDDCGQDARVFILASNLGLRHNPCELLASALTAAIDVPEQERPLGAAKFDWRPVAPAQPLADLPPREATIG